MQIRTLASGNINNPIYTKLSLGATVSGYSSDEALGAGDLVVIDASTCFPSDVSVAFASLDAGAALLLLDPTDGHKQAVAKHIGFRSKGASIGYYVVKQQVATGVSRYRIVEAGDSKGMVASVSQAVLGDANGVKETFPPQIAFQDVEQVQPLTDADVELFLAAIDTVVEPDTASSPPSELVWQQWVYSSPHSYTASGSVNSDTGMGPPPSKSISLLLTYTFQGALNNAPQSGAFQYLGLLETGIFQNNGMSNTDDDNYGWIIAALSPTYEAPASLFWYASSPSNTNDVTQVTTGSSVNIGFNNNGVSGGYTYSSSTTENITDWYIKQQTASSWLYAQNTPFDGSTTSASVASGCVNWYSGHINTSEFPVISTSSLQFAVDTVWKTNEVLSTEVDITISNFMQTDYMMVKEFLGLGTNFVLWTSQSTQSDSFAIDMSVIA